MLGVSLPIRRLTETDGSLRFHRRRTLYHSHHLLSHSHYCYLNLPRRGLAFVNLRETFWKISSV